MDQMKTRLVALSSKANELAELLGQFNMSHFTELEKSRHKHIRVVLNKALDSAYEIMDVADDAQEDEDNDSEDPRFPESEA